MSPKRVSCSPHSRSWSAKPGKAAARAGTRPSTSQMTAAPAYTAYAPTNATRSIRATRSGDRSAARRRICHASASRRRRRRASATLPASGRRRNASTTSTATMSRQMPTTNQPRAAATQPDVRGRRAAPAAGTAQVRDRPTSEQDEELHQGRPRRPRPWAPARCRARAFRDRYGAGAWRVVDPLAEPPDLRLDRAPLHADVGEDRDGPLQLVHRLVVASQAVEDLGELVPQRRLAMPVADRDAHLAAPRTSSVARPRRGRPPCARRGRARWRPPPGRQGRRAERPARGSRSSCARAVARSSRPAGQQARDGAGVGEGGVVAGPLGQRHAPRRRGGRRAPCRPAGGR